MQDIDLAYRERELSDSYFGHGGFKETDCVVDFENEVSLDKLDDEYLYPNGYTGYEQYYIDLEGF